MIPGSTIDERILNHSTYNWKKVAMIIALVTRDLGDKEQDMSSEVADRIRALVASHQIESRGDLSHWRTSEVRLAQRGHDGLEFQTLD